jgi:hypothetical protein
MPGISRRATMLAALALTLPVVALNAQQIVELPARDRALTESPVNVFTVGRAEGESWEMFSGISGMAFDDTDNLYVLDRENFRVVVFDASGRFVRQFGRRGAGPGEFQLTFHIAIDADGHVVVSDIGNRAYILFTADGRHVRNVPYGYGSGLPIGGVFADPRGGVITRINDPVNPESAPAGSFSTLYRQPLVDGAAPEQLTRLAIAPPQVIDAASSAGRNQRFMVRREPVFAPRISFGVLPNGGLAVHHDTEYLLRIYHANGQPARTVTRSIQPKRVTRRDQEAWQERQRSGSGVATQTIMLGNAPGGQNAAGSRATAEALGAGSAEFAEFMSVITGIRTDPQGRVWVQRRDTDGGEQGPIDLIDATGRYIGTIPPQPLPTAVSRSGLAAYTVRDDLGVQGVSVRRLPQSWR